MSRDRRILILGEGFSHDPHYGKTMRGIIRYGPDPVVAILDSQRAGEEHEGIPIVGTVDDALRFEPTVAVVGVATQGGRFPPAWRDLLKASIAAGLDVESGLHEFISDDPELTELARERGVELRDLRKPPAGLSVPTGANLEVDATIVLTVGSDCAIGKKTVAVELDLEARRRGLDSVFVPTGQTGIAIAGWGIAVDAVVSDFLAGAAEWLVVEGARRGGKLLFVEGPGLARPSDVLGRDARTRSRRGPTCVRPLPRGRIDGDRRLPRTRDPATHGPGRAPRAHLAPSPQGEGRVRRGEHRSVRRRRRRAACDLRDRRGNRASRGRSRPLRRPASA